MIPGWGTKIPHAVQYHKKKKERERERINQEIRDDDEKRMLLSMKSAL